MHWKYYKKSNISTKNNWIEGVAKVTIASQKLKLLSIEQQMLKITRLTSSEKENPRDKQIHLNFPRQKEHFDLNQGKSASIA